MTPGRVSIRERPSLLSETSGTHRPEIQALRAIAVLGVVIYHLWPESLPGGYVGVDIFFVISGFLITAHLLRDATANGQIHLGRFWARRARRLLPASLLVIAASAVATLVWLPEQLWQQFFKEFAASALYIENWLLAGDSIDYLAAENEASPVQHYWSLSAEEQFYLVWPLLILLAFWVSGRVHKINTKTTVAITLGIVTTASLAYSIYLTATDPLPAYFVTPTRAWEFGLGGILAVFTANATIRRRMLSTAVSWLGLAGVVITMFVFTDKTPFPGWTALIPTVATVLVIVAGLPDSKAAPSAILQWRPVQWTGDISYSLYLWHWPLIVIAPFALRTDLTPWHAVGVLLASIVLAWLTKVFVEDTTRTNQFLSRWNSLPTLVATVLSMALVVGVAASVWTNVEEKAELAVAKAQADVDEIIKESPSCFGPVAAEHGFDACENAELAGKLFPDPSMSERDKALPEDANCRVTSRQSGVKKCTLAEGSESGLRVVLVGDSHAEHWAPAIVEIAKKRGWTVDTYLKGGCPFSNVMREDDASSSQGTCEPWNRAVLKRIEGGDYDVVFTSQVTGREFERGADESSLDAQARGLVALWSQIDETTGARVVPIRDNPFMNFRVGSCLARFSDAAAERADECSSERSEVLLPDPQASAASQSGIGIIDLTDYFCDEDLCYSVVGSVIVYRDTAHLGGTYSRLLSPYFEEQLDSILAG